MALNYREEDALAIIDFWKTHGLNSYAISAWLGNWYIESGFRSNNGQNYYMTKFNITDEEYTKEVDNGTWKRPDTGKPFVADSIGYGLAQWTSSGRKAGLYNYVKGKGKPISDMQAQMEWAYIELTSKGFKAVYEALINATEIKNPTIIVMHDFEKPASKDNPTKQAERVACAEEFYAKYFGGGDMAKPDSKLVDYFQLSPRRNSPRLYKIDGIIIHCYVGQVSVERAGKGWSTYDPKGGSANYLVAFDGKIGQYVPESDRAWTTGGKWAVNGMTGREFDHHTVTIEVASDATAPYAITDAAYKSLVKLCADICQRNAIRELKWQGDKNLVGVWDKQNMGAHRWFTNKECPGDYIFNRLGQIAREVNQILNGDEPEPAVVTIIKHTVAKGENLTKIAARYDVTVYAIAKANNLKDPNKIVVGQVLDIPVKSDAIPTTYTVVAGDTLSKIAKKVGHGCTWQALAKVNDIKAPYIIRKGQVLKLPELN